MTLRRRLGCLSLLFVLGFGFFVWRRIQDPPPGAQGEVLEPDEDRYTASTIASAVALIEGAQKPGDVHHRDVHAKAHGCVKATVQVGDVDARLRHGLFAANRTYKAWIRFSSGDTRQQADKVRDARGFALKVMGVPGEKLLEAEKDEQTQDFIMINSRTFFVRTLADYAGFMRTMGDGSRYSWFFGGSSPDPRRWRLRELLLAIKTLKAAPRSPLDPQYHSLSAYALGPDLFVKYSAKPCDGWKGKGGKKSGDNFLREALRADLQGGDGCFDLLVQPQVAGRNMPVEDTTIEWREKDSPFVKVARVSIPAQAFDTPEQNAFCEALSFTPWHALPAHRPAGAMNRLRKAVYQEISRFRHAKSGTPRAEPRGWCLDLSGQPCPGEE
jgi:catalase